MSTENTAIRPYRVDVPQADLDDLAYRLAHVVLPDELPDAGDAYGVPTSRVARLVKYWREEFDWRAYENRLNQHPQFVNEIDGANVHFLHVRSERADAMPLILTHGWPGSVAEFLDIVDTLANPPSAQEPAFHLVIPSLPGFTFSGPTKDKGWNTIRTARAWVELMHRLGYDRYGAVGNDAGSMISPEIGRLDPESVVGVHVTQLFSFPSGDPAEFQGLSDDDQAGLARLQWFYENKFSFNVVHSQQPQTLAPALVDSPVGLLAWNAQLLPDSVGDEFIIANVASYWLTRTGGSAIRFYYEDAHNTQRPTGQTTTPTGLAMFAGDFQSIRRFAERDHANIVSWHSYPATPDLAGEDVGGHYAAHEQPDVLARDIREFFAGLATR